MKIILFNEGNAFTDPLITSLWDHFALGNTGLLSE